MLSDGFIQLSSVSFQSTSNGYIQTKIVSEDLLTTARQKLQLEVNIFRPTWVLWAENDRIDIKGIKNSLVLLVIGCFQMKMFPEIDFKLNIWPADIASQIIVAAAHRSRNKAFNLFNERQLSWCVLMRTLSIRLRREVNPCPFEMWRDALQKIDESNALFCLGKVYSSDRAFADGSSVRNLRLDGIKEVLKELEMPFPDPFEYLLKLLTAIVEEYLNTKEGDQPVKAEKK